MSAEDRDARLADALDDLLARRRRGEAVGSDAYRERLGDDTPALEGALRAAEVLEAAADGLGGGGGEGGGASAPTRYRLGRELGRGGAGIVFEAFDTELERTVAWKTVRPDVRLDAAAIDRFRREARACASLRHPHVVAVHDAGELDGRPWYAMELVRGGTLADRLRLRTQPPLPALLRGLAGVADGLAALHAAGLVHRDVKPSNVLVRDDGSFALADFGLARALDGRGLTQAGQVLGSPPYMSPEQALGRLDAVDARTDVYALGATVFHAVTGAPPFVGDDPGDLLRRVRDERPPRASSRVPGLPRGLDAVLARALEKRPEDRTPSAASLRDDLLALADGRTPPSLRAARTRRVALAALVACALGGALAIGLPSRSRLHAMRIDTLPAADLEIDGAAAGRTPLLVELARGPHRILARRGGFDPATWAIEVPGPASAPPPSVLAPLPEHAAAGELALVEAALGHPFAPWDDPPSATTPMAAADDPGLSQRRAALLHRVSAAPPSVRRVALAAFDVEAGRFATAVTALEAAPPSERTPLGDRLLRHAQARLASAPDRR